MLDLAHECRGLRRFDYISTAFVAGCRRGVVYEHELDEGQLHNNGYERSKFEAERLVRGAANRLPVTIHRPSIITCETRTGDVSSRSAFGRLLGAYASGMLTGLPGRPDTRLDLVPVDFVADAVFAIAQRDETIGGTLHLAMGEKRSPTLAEVCDLAASHFGRPPLSLLSGDGGGEPAGRMNTEGSAARELREEVALYQPYLDNELGFDITAASRILDEVGIAVTDPAGYFDAMARAVTRAATASPSPGADRAPTS
jgi:nucleoside-diphosphate-sugar epimerase